MTRSGLRITGLASLMAAMALLLAGSPGAVVNGDQPAPAAAGLSHSNPPQPYSSTRPTRGAQKPGVDR